MESLPPVGHDPVLLHETLDALRLEPGKTIVDCTLGRGGHAAAIAERLAPSGLLLACDVDPRNLDYARQRLANAPCRVRFFHANFGELPEVLRAAEIPTIDGILADLGTSTNQLFDPHY